MPIGICITERITIADFPEKGCRECLRNYFEYEPILNKKKQETGITIKSIKGEQQHLLCAETEEKPLFEDCIGEFDEIERCLKNKHDLFLDWTF